MIEFFCPMFEFSGKAPRAALETLARGSYFGDPRFSALIFEALVSFQGFSMCLQAAECSTCGDSLHYLF